MIHAPQVCDYNGTAHLCFFQGVQLLGWSHGHGVIVDRHYRTIKSIEPSGSYQASSDQHEFRVIDDGKHALMTQYLRSVHDLCDFGLCNGLGYVQQGSFQEIDVETGDVLFEWRSLDHIALSESNVPPSSTEISGTGESPTSPWDYFHINSIDKNADGDYLISARHTSAVYKISGKTGRVLWRLNGARSDFELVNFGFSFQHDARWISDDADASVISLFNNGGNGYTQTHPHSDGKIIRIDHASKQARVVQKINPPFIDGHAHYAKSQGNMQTLPSGGLVMGWGNDAFLTEYSAGETEAEREIVFYGYLALRNMMNYRAHKFDGWVGLPLTKPALWTYSKTGAGSMMLYASWNGATEVREWRFFGAAGDGRDGPYAPIATVRKDGFETIYRHDASAAAAFKWTYAEALDKDGKILGTSAVQETYTPQERMREFCDDLACRLAPTAEEREAEQQAAAERARQQQEAGQSAVQRWLGRKRNLVLLGGVLGSVVVLVVVAVLVAVTDNVVARRARALGSRAWSAVIGGGKKRGEERGLEGAEYKPLTGDDGDGDGDGEREGEGEGGGRMGDG